MATGVHRFLSKREGKRKDRNSQHQHHPLTQKAFSSSTPELAPRPCDPESAADFYGLFDLPLPLHTNHTEDAKVRQLQRRLLKEPGVALRDPQLLWALRSNFANSDVDAAYDLLRAMYDASIAIVTPYDANTRLLGAQNRQGVTCFLDATLFSMFSRLDSFEKMLYNSFDDVRKNKLAFVLRVWVNLLRSGRLITTDITAVVQNTIADCGWARAAELTQQDASEAFLFITEQLNLPLLTLKVDLYHTGKEDAEGDHKLMEERLLQVAIPSAPAGDGKEITLEECLEDYFNNRVEVRRFLERRSTINSLRKKDAIHVETVELEDDQSPMTPLSPEQAFASPIRPAISRTRAPSIIQERYIPPRKESGYSTLAPVDTKDSSRSRAGSVRKEVLMPAWQFFSLIPWYTNHAPANDAQMAAHFSSERPMLGICLKRYSATADGGTVRNGTQIDIPVEIAVPYFIQDENIEENNGLHGNFKLSLQAVVCHRGQSVHSGHYIALVRGTAVPGRDRPYTNTTQCWLRFDDLAQPRIQVVDIERALREETPYLLFYQIVPIEGDPGNITSGEESLSTVHERTASFSEASSVAATDNQSTSGRPSFDMTVREEVNGRRGRSPNETRRASVVSFHEPVARVITNPTATEPPPVVPNGTDTTNALRPPPTSRSQSKNSDSGGSSIGRTLSKLRRKSRDVSPRPAELLPQTQRNDVPQPSVPAAQPVPISVQQVVPYHPQTTTPRLPNLQVQPQPVKTHKREKSKSRHMKSRSSDEKPDRECIVM